MNLALGLMPPATPVYYAADTNVIDLALHAGRVPAQRLSVLPLARRAAAALSLGLTNRLAFEALGFRRIVELPVCAVDFPVLDASSDPPGLPPRNADETVFVVIARLAPVKNLPALVAALAAQPDLHAGVRLVLAGDGPDRNALERLRERHSGLKLDMIGAASRQQIGALLRRADALLLPSRFEPWGIVVTEALGMGIPVVATPVVGAAVSLAGTTQAILLSESVEPESIVAALRTFVERSQALTLAARASQSLVRARYDREQVARALVELVERGR
jgi:glycosyltransferase involved in cell wall biosynthesis